MKRVTASLILLLFAAPVLAQEPVQEREHVVKKGDTLWDLAGFYFSDPFSWPSIYRANTAVVEDPHWIYPDEVLVIPGLTRAAEPVAAVPAAPRAAPSERRRAMAMGEVDPGSMDPNARTVFYRPPPEPQTAGSPTVLSEPVREVVPVRPGELNSAPFLARSRELDVRARFVRALRENRDVGGAPSAHPKETVFMGYRSQDRPAVGDRLLLVRDVGSARGIGQGLRVIEPRAVVRILELQPEVMLAQIESQYAPVHRGDLAIPMPLYPDFAVEEAQPVEGGHDLEGRVLQFMDDPPLPKRTDVAFIDRGSRHGVQVGDLFAAYLPERAARAREPGEFRSYVEELPPETVAVLRVVRVTEHAATALVDRLMLPRLEDGIRVRRTHRIP